MKTLLPLLPFFLLLLTALPLRAQTPHLLNYQGRVAADGVDFHGAGQFKFALVNDTGTISYWSNDGTGTAGGEPVGAVTLTVTEGKYSVLLGDTSLTNMTALPPGLFSNPGVRLRVWFNDGTNGSQLFSPDARIEAPAPVLKQRGKRGPGDEADGGTGIWFQRPGGSPPAGRSSATTVWTGSEMLVWGGYVTGNAEEGGRYNPVTNSWSIIRTTDAPTRRTGHTAVWTGTEMIVWGGISGFANVNSGGKYNPSTDRWTAVNLNGPSARTNHTAVWTGTEMIVWGGTASDTLGSGSRYRPLADSWIPVTNTGAASPRSFHTAIWTGMEMVVWGGNDGTNYVNDGARYNPEENQWTGMSNAAAPARRGYHTTVWTGSEMIVWGGYDGAGFLNTGGRYHAANNTWSAVGIAGAPLSRYYHSAVWSGSEMIVWGGFHFSGDTGFSLNDGARYNVSTGQWTPVSLGGAPGARNLHSAVWTGSQMVVWGGANASDSGLRDGGRYTPASDRWQTTENEGGPIAGTGQTAIWTGSEMLMWGGYGAGDYLNTGARYNPVTSTWTPMSTQDAPNRRGTHTTIWTGSEMIIWGGYGAVPVGTDPRQRSGGRYRPATDTWSATSLLGAPSARYFHTAIWTGTEMIIWGGDGGGYQRTVSRYNPQTNLWTEGSVTGAPTGRFLHTAVWTGAEMIVWGGYDGATQLFTGGRYNPVSNTWTATGFNGLTGGRSAHSAIWTGTEMLVWGGAYVPDFFAEFIKEGLRYNPSGDYWTPMSTVNAPEGRELFTTVWTGTEMIVWGGDASGGSYFNDGGRYNPVTDTWLRTTTTGAPSPRSRAMAVWTGNQMLLWGGLNQFWINELFSYYPDAGVFRINSLSRSGSSFIVNFNAPLGRRTTLWYSDSMEAGTWQDTGLPAITGTGSPQNFVFPVPSGPRRFYRVQDTP